jgi:hypothetical protein
MSKVSPTTLIGRGSVGSKASPDDIGGSSMYKPLKFGYNVEIFQGGPEVGSADTDTHRY